MIITCAQCNTSFNLDEGLLSESGSKVRCSKCQHIFVAYPPLPPSEETAVPVEPLVETPTDAPTAATTEFMETPPADVVVEEMQRDTEMPQMAEDEFDADAAAAVEHKPETTEADQTDALAEEVAEVAPESEVQDAAEDFVTEVEEIDAVEEIEDISDTDAPEASSESAEALDFSFEPEEITADAADIEDGLDQPEREAPEDVSLADLDGDTEPEIGPEDAIEIDSISDDIEGEPLEALETEEIDFGLEPEESAAPEPQLDAVAGEAGDEDLDDLNMEDLDLSLDADTATTGEDAEVSPAEEPEDLLGDDFDFDLDPDMDESADADAPVVSEESDELDLSDVEALFEEESATAEETAVPDVEEDLDIDFDLDAVLEPDEGETGSAEPVADIADEEDLDLSDVDDMFQETDMLDTDAGADPGEEDLGLELDAALTPEAPVEGATDEVGEALESVDETDLEDLDFELDMEFEELDDIGADTTDLTPSGDASEDLDLSDLEEMLGEDDAVADEGAGEALEDVTADTAQTEKWQSEPGSDLMADTAELDLTELEKVLDGDDDGEIPEVAGAGEDLELDLDLPDDLPPADEELDLASDTTPLELDVADLEEVSIEDGLAPEGEGFDSGDIELEFEIEEDTEELAETTEAVSAMAAAPAEAAVATAAKPAKKAKKKKRRRRRPVRRRGLAGPFLLILLLIILGLAAVVGLDRAGIKTPYVGQYLRQIPYLNQFLSPETQTPVGEIRTVDISSKFVDNVKHGKLLVIMGKVENTYPEARRFIRVKGNLFSTGKQLVQMETVYVGNMMSVLELANTELTEIKKRLANRFGDNKANLNLAPNAELPFMIVFAELPDDLEEFTVEVAGSFPIKKGAT